MIQSSCSIFQKCKEVIIMKILGIVAEYDPFHNGHLFHIREAAKRVSPDLTYIVLSPCIKQRGEHSLLSPSDRARLALEAGADAVFCLPVCWAVRDAEHYAFGSVSLLAGLGVTHLAFGAETAFPNLLIRAAACLEEPSALFESVLKGNLTSGSGWPAAVSSALSFVLPEAQGLLDRPNNILAVCYLRAIRRLCLSVQPVVIPRTGSYHAAGINPAYPSASALRESLRRGDYNHAYSAMPPYSADLIRRRFLDGCIPDDQILDHLLLSRLRSMTHTEYAALPDLAEGMENALRTAASSANTREKIIDTVYGKRYPAARISRLCTYALLGITKSQLDHLPPPDHALLLGLRKTPGMTSLWKSLSLPVLSSFTEWKKAAHPADLAAWRLWAQCCRLPDTLPFTDKMITVG